MQFSINFFTLFFLLFLLFAIFYNCQASSAHYKLVVKEATYRRLCSSKKILTVNGQFPGPTVYAHRGDTIIVDVHNKGNYNITIHWHGVKQPRNPWGDGTEYITQCPIVAGAIFRQKIILSTEEGTLWWHAHSDWSRATVHGALIIYPNVGSTYPFPKPHAQLPIILGEWWKADMMKMYREFVRTGADSTVSDANTINGQPGDLYPCSKQDTFKLKVRHGKTYLLRVINAGMQDIFFFSIANHNFTVVASDASYTKPFTTHLMAISPGQTIDVLLHANQNPNHYYMAAKVYTGAKGVTFDNTTTTAILQYVGNYNPSSPPLFPKLPQTVDAKAAFKFIGSFRSLADKKHPIDVPLEISKKLFFTISINLIRCRNNSCGGPNGSRISSSVNNISFVNPAVDILKAYYYGINGVYGTRFPSFPPYVFNFTADNLPLNLLTPKRGTEVMVLDYNSTVEIVFQETNLVAGTDHPIHLHGFSFYVVGWGFGNFDPEKDPLRYNLVDPPLQNTIVLPVKGWTTIRFKAQNPGVWFIHCHFERHMSWGMNTVFIVKNGKSPAEQMLPPPAEMPAC